MIDAAAVMVALIFHTPCQEHIRMV